MAFTELQLSKLTGWSFDWPDPLNPWLRKLVNRSHWKRLGGQIFGIPMAFGIDSDRIATVFFSCRIASNDSSCFFKKKRIIT